MVDRTVLCVTALVMETHAEVKRTPTHSTTTTRVPVHNNSGNAPANKHVVHGLDSMGARVDGCRGEAPPAHFRTSTTHQRPKKAATLNCTTTRGWRGTTPRNNHPGDAPKRNANTLQINVGHRRWCTRDSRPDVRLQTPRALSMDSINPDIARDTPE